MRAPIQIAKQAVMAGVLICAAQPVFAQDVPDAGTDASTDASTNDGADDDIITITPEMVEERGSRVLSGQQIAPPPDGRSATIPADRVTPPTGRSGPPSVLAILAHPDDEITIAPVLARMVRGGGTVTIVFATSGDAGPGVSGLEPGAELADLREDEARCSAFALGLPEPIFWQLGDGTLAQNDHVQGSPARRMEERIAALIALEQPQVVMTWGPDGGYGHADHRMVSNAVTQIVGAMESPRPDLLYAAFPSDTGTGDARGALPGFENWATTHPSLITDRIRYEMPDLDATRNAIDCYQSQFNEDARAYLPAALHQNLWRGTVFFRLAFAAES